MPTIANAIVELNNVPQRVKDSPELKPRLEGSHDWCDSSPLGEVD
jgi:hypothetical protein